MSNALAIAAVTTMLDYLLTHSLARSAAVSLESVTAKPPDKAREGGESTNQINIFLYQILPNAAWRNQSLPNRVKPGETGRDSLALTLSYLITAYGKNNDDIEGQRLLGMAMQTLHDRPEIRPQDIERSLESANLLPDKQELLASSNLKNQIERVRITPQILSVEEISKMWATFQTPYRISAAYEVSVVLIESGVPVKAALPVLTRGNDDRGVRVQANLTPPTPTLESLSWPGIAERMGLRIGDSLTLKGHHLDGDGDTVLARFSHPQRDRPIEVPLQRPISPNEITIVLSNEASSAWLAGFYTVSLRYEQGETSRFSNALSVAIAPTLTNITVTNHTLTLNCTPAVHPNQPASLLLGSQEIPFEQDLDDVEPSSRLSFSLNDVAAGDY
ncbi:MAG: DUF4255 domain-containing protein, partial [Phormidesmis sp.]